MRALYRRTIETVSCRFTWAVRESKQNLLRFVQAPQSPEVLPSLNCGKTLFWRFVQAHSMSMDDLARQCREGVSNKRKFFIDSSDGKTQGDFRDVPFLLLQFMVLAGL